MRQNLRKGTEQESCIAMRTVDLTQKYIKVRRAIADMQDAAHRFRTDASDDAIEILRGSTRAVLTATAVYLQIVWTGGLRGNKEKLARSVNVGMHLLSVVKGNMQTFQKDEWAKMHISCALDLTTSAWRHLPEDVLAALIKEERESIETVSIEDLRFGYEQIHDQDADIRETYREAFNDYLEMHKVLPKLADIIPINLRRSKK